MKYRTLPGTQLHVSEVCLGTMTWGEQNSEREAHLQLDFALAQGINFIDTAEMYPVPPNATTYGRTETYLGQLAGARRRATVSSSPARWPARGGATGFAAAAPNSPAKTSPKRWTTSLARLQIDCIDLYQIHWPQRNVPMFGVTEFDPAKEKHGPPIREQVESHGRH